MSPATPFNSNIKRRFVGARNSYGLQVMLALLFASFVGLMIGCRSFPKTAPANTGTPKVNPRASTPRNDVFPRVIEGRIVAITDGDTVKVLTAKNMEYKIRLASIDTPEKKQPFREEAKQYLSSLIFEKQVRINATKLDRYGRTIGQIFFEDRDVNLDLVRAGLAWHYKQYENEQNAEDRKAYADAELDARNRKIGIWSLSNPEPPWANRRPPSR